MTEAMDNKTLASEEQTGENVPPTKVLRERLREAARDLVREQSLTPPLSMSQLKRSAGELLSRTGQPDDYRDYVAILIHNGAWWEQVAGIPFDRRLLLLPQCLRHPTECKGEIDELGLTCARCGRCPIADLQAEAERLGYAVLVAEGSPVVMSLIESGQVRAVIGVSCISVLEQVFPYMEAGAVPGVAIPLLRDGCSVTAVDLDWVREAIRLTAATESDRPDLKALRNHVDSWFTGPALSERLGRPLGRTEQIARNWLADTGKRWRPFLAAAVYQALTGDSWDSLPACVTDTAVAVECFHKASLVHDDIEDRDPTRYGRATLHEQHGVPVALNVGDLLIGEGYRLIARADVPDAARAGMLRAAAEGHHALCLGQGAELCCLHGGETLKPDEVLEIFAQKTAPAFEVALQLGAICAGPDGELTDVLRRYSRSLGIAYQIHDDIDDFLHPTDPRNSAHLNIIAALDRSAPAGTQSDPLRTAAKLMEQYKSQAVAALDGLKNPDVKALLRRGVGKIFCDFEIMGCCNDHPSGNAGRRPTGEGPAG